MAAELKRGLSPTHEQMIEWCLQNPGGTLREMSAYFGGYSISWLSQICNSDMFKAALAERLGEIRAVVTLSIPQRMEALAAQVCERLGEVLTNTQDPELVVDTFDKVMHRYGYAPNAKTGMQGGVVNNVQQNNVFYLTKDEFQKNREKLIGAHGTSNPPAPEVPVAQLPEKV